MAFDDRKTEPLIAVGCLSIVCALIAPGINWLTQSWWGLLLFALPLVMWLLIGFGWRWERPR